MNSKTKECEAKYDIVKTTCFPCQYKIVRAGNYRTNNGSTEYFKTVDEAVDEIARRGAELGVIDV